MSNSVTNAKLTTGDSQGQNNQTAPNNLTKIAPASVSAVQSREIFSQVNVHLRVNVPNVELQRGKEKPAADNDDSSAEKTDWEAIRQGTDSVKKSKIQGTEAAQTQKTQETDSPEPAKNQTADSPDAPKNPHVKNAAMNGSDNPETHEQTRNNDAAKSNDNHSTTQSNNATTQSNKGNNDSAPKNDYQSAAQTNENRSAKPSAQLRGETSNDGKINEKNDENRNLTSRDGSNSAQSNGESNRPQTESINRENANQNTISEQQDAANALPNELNRGRGYGKTEQGQGKSEQNNQSSAKPSANNQNSIKFLPGNQNPANVPEDAAVNAPLFNDRNRSAADRAPGRNAPSGTAPRTRQLDLTINVSAPNKAKNDLNWRGVRQNEFLGEIINQVFRENDVYLSKNAVHALIKHGGENASNRSNNPALKRLPEEILRLVETIENQILQTSEPRQINHKHASNTVNIEIPHELDNQIRAAKNLFAQIFGASEAKHFSRLNIQERMLAAIEIFLKNLPPEMPKSLQINSAEKVLAGFLLARGFVNCGGNVSTVKLLEMMQTAGGAADKVSLAAMRDFGGLVKVLISDAATAKSNVNLKIAVEKFARILVAINCLDAVLTAVKLATQSQFANGNVGRTLAIVQVYELINRLISAGHNAMRETAVEIAQKNAALTGESDKNSRSVFPAKTIADLIETDRADEKTGESKNVGAESALRKFLEFNPMLASDRFVSAFENFDDARQAQSDFLNHHQIEIEQWLRSGNHRLVKDIAFEKPIGIVVERNQNDFYSATTARIVLVRDGSVQGWHFLKSFLVA